MTRRSVAIRIAGQEYKVRSDADDGFLQEVAAYVDETMAQLRDRTGMVDSHSIAVLTCLNLAKQVIGLREDATDGGALDGDDRVRALIELAESALSRPDAADDLLSDSGGLAAGDGMLASSVERSGATGAPEPGA